MTPQEEWRRVAARLHGLRAAADLVFGRDHLGAAQHWLLPSVYLAANEIEAFGDRNKTRLSKEVSQSIDRGMALFNAKLGDSSGLAQIAAHSRVAGFLAALLSIESEVSFLLHNFDEDVRPLVEKAFLHLQRLILIDPYVQGRWQAAMTDGGERACEMLGAVHLLNHGIYAFKAHSQGEQTDLMLGERLTVTPTLRQATAALVLTEWKIAADARDATQKFNAARVQASIYGDSSLAGFELATYRYLVVVSDDACAVPEDVMTGTVTYRHINLAIGRPAPSQLAKRSRESPGKAPQRRRGRR